MDKYHCEYPDISTTASATDCTGLMLRPPQSEEEYESYLEIYGLEFPNQWE